MLAAVNRRLRDEVLPMFYSESRFVLKLARRWGEWNRFANVYASPRVHKSLSSIRVALYTAVVNVSIMGEQDQVWELTMGVDMAGRTHCSEPGLRALTIDSSVGQNWEAFIKDVYLTMARVEHNIHETVRRELPIINMAAALGDLVRFSDHGAKMIRLQEL